MHHSDVEDVKDRGEDLVEVQPQLSSQIGRTTGKINAGGWSRFGQSLVSI